MIPALSSASVPISRPVATLDLRLVMQDQLSGFHRPAQAGIKGNLRHHIVVHLFVEKAVGITPGIFGSRYMAISAFFNKVPKSAPSSG